MIEYFEDGSYATIEHWNGRWGWEVVHNPTRVSAGRENTKEEALAAAKAVVGSLREQQADLYVVKDNFECHAFDCLGEAKDAAEDSDILVYRYSHTV